MGGWHAIFQWLLANMQNWTQYPVFGNAISQNSTDISLKKMLITQNGSEDDWPNQRISRVLKTPRPRKSRFLTCISLYFVSLWYAETAAVGNSDTIKQKGAAQTELHRRKMWNRGKSGQQEHKVHHLFSSFKKKYAKARTLKGKADRYIR